MRCCSFALPVADSWLVELLFLLKPTNWACLSLSLSLWLSFRLLLSFWGASRTCSCPTAVSLRLPSETFNSCTHKNLHTKMYFTYQIVQIYITHDSKKCAASRPKGTLPIFSSGGGSVFDRLLVNCPLFTLASLWWWWLL